MGNSSSLSLSLWFMTTNTSLSIFESALQHYLKTGTCKYGPACKYHHPRDKNGVGPVPLNSLGLPMRQVLSSCLWFLPLVMSCQFHQLNHFPVLGIVAILTIRHKYIIEIRFLTF